MPDTPAIHEARDKAYVALLVSDKARDGVSFAKGVAHEAARAYRQYEETLHEANCATRRTETVFAKGVAYESARAYRRAEDTMYEADRTTRRAETVASNAAKAYQSASFALAILVAQEEAPGSLRAIEAREAIFREANR